jgi:hypothetical protein
MRDAPFVPNELQKALLGYEATALEEALIDWTRENWAMAARGQVYCKKEALETIRGARGVRTDENKLVLELATRVAIAERELLCRALGAILPDWLEQTYGLKPPAQDAEAATPSA